MDLALWTEFFKWCTIINVGILTFWAILFAVMPDFIFRMHSQWFKLTRERFDALVYGMIGIYKLMIIVMNLVPYLALRIIG